ncbi:hypothetical protein M8C21_015070 [Ambrosia artemisiifolia]|uniref:Uncharacterized protein n=1 Tax=Ambrosia artemisiifolia TaxID=4212 RepID=A0AAD5CPB7_AMBAR|nr:hypothetical protein M8C21_015070 [Ambrosia artemisiifolia]
MSMLTRLFGKPKQEANVVTTLDKLNETLEMLEKKENVLKKKSNAEVQKAKEFTNAKNKRAAIQCLKRKRLYEQQIEQLGNFQLRIHDQMIMLESAKATTETVDALRTGAKTMKEMHEADELEAELEELEGADLEEQLLQPAIATPAAPVPVPAGKQPTHPAQKQKTGSYPARKNFFHVSVSCGKSWRIAKKS